MRSVLTCIAMVVMATIGAFSQVPSTLNFQGTVVDDNGEPLNSNLDVRVEIFEDATSVNAIWGENHPATRFNKGYFSITLGVNESLDQLDFTSQYWIRYSIDGGNTFSNRVPLEASAYSLTAKTVEDGGITQEKIADGVRLPPTGLAGGDLIGEYPNPRIDPSIIDTIYANFEVRNGSITQEKLSNNVTTNPSGPAAGDLTGSYPDPLIAPGAVTSDKIENRAVTRIKIADDAIISQKIENGSLRTVDFESGSPNSLLFTDASGIVSWASTFTLSTATIDGDLFVHGRSVLDSLVLPNGAQDGYILKTDASGNATWASPAEILAGSDNTVSGTYSSVGGGFSNTVSGDYSSVGGGSDNLVEGDYSQASGYKAAATADYSIAIKLNNNSTTFENSTPNSMAVQADKVYFDSELEVTKTSTFTGGITLPTDAEDGYVLTSDAEGNATWVESNDSKIDQLEQNITSTYNALSSSFNALGTISSQDADAVEITGGSATVSSFAYTNNPSYGYVLKTDASGNATWASPAEILAGPDNTVSGTYSSVVGGWLNKINARSSSIVGGEHNLVTGRNSSIVGGGYNTASGVFSQAGGFKAAATANYSIAIKLNSGSTTFENSKTSSMAVLADGGFRFYTNYTATIGAELRPRANSWSTLSDSTKKENFEYLNSDKILSSYAKINPRSWNYIGQDGMRHYGPMAQEYDKYFGLDSYGKIGNDTTLTSMDLAGLNFSAISFLSKKVKNQQDNSNRLDLLEKQNAKLEKQNAKLEKQNKEIKNEIEELKKMMKAILENE